MVPLGLESSESFIESMEYIKNIEVVADFLQSAHLERLKKAAFENSQVSRAYRVRDKIDALCKRLGHPNVQ